MTATATVTVSADTEAPTAPTNVTATATGATAIEVAWTASTDDVGVVGYAVERCTGVSCTDFVEVGTPTGSPWVDAGLTGATSYRYRVRAGDAAGNRSSYSAIAAATTAVAAPVISSFTATPTAVTAGQAATLAWTTSGGTTVAIAPGVGTVSATGSASVSPAATTTYTLTASNSGGTVTATATVTVSADTEAPTAPTNVTATATGATAIEVAWTASTDDVGVVGYAVERCTGVSCTDFVEVGTPTGSPWVDAGLTGATSYRYRVRAGDAAGIGRATRRSRRRRRRWRRR